MVKKILLGLLALALLLVALLSSIYFDKYGGSKDYMFTSPSTLKGVVSAFIGAASFILFALVLENKAFKKNCG